MPLSEFKISKAKAKEKAYKLTDAFGLYLLVKPNGSKLWQQRYRHLNRERTLSHGRYPILGLAEARRRCTDARRILADGKDPAVQKKLATIEAQVAARMTFRLVAEDYLENVKERELAPATMRKKRWYLLDLCQPIHDRPVGEITSAELLYLLKAIERSGRRETAKKMRAAISAVFRFAIVTLRAETDPTLPLRDALLPPRVTGRAAITDEKQFSALLAGLDEFTGWPVIVEAIKFQILTMTRPGEVRGAAKSEFDLEKRVWTIPAERMKMRREHHIPLSEQALAIVKANWPQIDGVELVFPSLVSNRKWLSENAFNSALRRMGWQKDEVTAHGFRVTASTMLNSRGYDPDVIEAALAHQDKNVIRRTYNRSTYWEKRVELMQVWADLCDGFRSGA
jgi:integrase